MQQKDNKLLNNTKLQYLSIYFCLFFSPSWCCPLQEPHSWFFFNQGKVRKPFCHISRLSLSYSLSTPPFNLGLAWACICYLINGWKNFAGEVPKIVYKLANVGAIWLRYFTSDLINSNRYPLKTDGTRTNAFLFVVWKNVTFLTF